MQANVDPFATPVLARYFGGMIPAPQDDRDFPYAALPHNLKAIQQNHDLRSYKGQSLALPVRDQGNLGSCTGFCWTAVRGAMAARYHLDRDEDPALGDNISARYLYHEERARLGTWPQDSGSDMRTGAQVLLDEGCCPERYAPYTAQAQDGPITQEMRDAAAFYAISGYFRCAGTGQSLINSILQALDLNVPVALAILVCEEFERTGADGKVPMPRQGSPVLGGHAISCFGSFADNSAPGGGYLLFQNSWSSSWAQDGWGFLPYAYSTFQTSQGALLQEAWVAA